MDNHSKFEKAKRYRIVSFWVFILFPAFIVLAEETYIADWVGYLLSVLTFGTAVVLSMQYKCPVCKAGFDTRVPPSRLKHCPNCGVHLGD